MAPALQRRALLTGGCALLLSLCFGCADLTDKERPTALYGQNQPGAPVETDASVVLTGADERAVPLKIFYPRSAERQPVIVLSHGTFSNIDRYDLIAEYWAAHGYVVILPQHKDADYGVRPSDYAVMQGVAMSRVADMSLVLDNLAVIEQRVPALAGKLVGAAYIAAGHSMGTQVAMLVTGLQFRTPFDEAMQASDENRFSALVLVSDPGKMRLMPLDLWVGSSVPTFMATGTDDYGLMGQRGEPTEKQSEMVPNTAQVARYELLLKKGDHYFGGLIQKEVDADPDPEGLAIFNALSVAFLDAYVKDQRQARDYLERADIVAITGGRATLIASD